MTVHSPQTPGHSARTESASFTANALDSRNGSVTMAASEMTNPTPSIAANAPPEVSAEMPAGWICSSDEELWSRSVESAFGDISMGVWFDGVGWCWFVMVGGGEADGEGVRESARAGAKAAEKWLRKTLKDALANLRAAGGSR